MNYSETFLLNRRTRILKVVSICVIIIGIISISNALFSFLQNIEAGLTGTLGYSFLSSFGSILIGGVVYQMARSNRPGVVKAAAYVITLTYSLLVFISVITTNFNPITLGAMLLPLLCAGLLFDSRELLFWLFGQAFLLVISFVITLNNLIPSAISTGAATAAANDSNGLIVTNFVCFLSLLLLMGGGLWYLQLNVKEILAEVSNRALAVTELSQDREERRQFGEKLNTRLNTMTSELSSTTLQQLVRTQQQASAVLSVTTGLNELSDTARQIASNSLFVNKGASAARKSAEEVKEDAERATANAERGQNAVSSAVQAIEDVRTGIGTLGERLKILTESSRQINSIIALIKEIADQTHLLSLNASIESAGAGEHGLRFGVIAAEVKKLADRSLTATSEVNQVIGELQGAIFSAVLASEETRHKTFGAVTLSYQAGQVISDLGRVVRETTESAGQIVSVVEQVVVLTQDISQATQQQENAIGEIVSIMREVGTVAQENVSGVSQVSATVGEIDQLSAQLKDVLGLRQAVSLSS